MRWWDWLLAQIKTKERASPQARIGIHNVKLNPMGKGLYIEVHGMIAEELKINTNSMDPLMDVGHVILFKKFNNDINVGDVIIFKHNKYEIVHRVIKIDQDKKGTFYRTKGDNNLGTDNVKVRPWDVKYIVVGVLW